MTPSTPNDLYDALIVSWEQQQDGYVRHRGQRFEIVLDALSYTRPGWNTVLDIGGGLGSFSKRILERFPEIRVWTLDYDPALLELARHNLRSFGSRSVVIEADLRDPTWPTKLDDTTPEAIVSSTALHWLSGAQLVALYQTLATVLAEGGAFFNADHLSCGGRTFLGAASAADDSRQQQAAFTADVPNWDGWWAQARAVTALAEHVAERDRRFAGTGDNLDPTPTLHTEALRVAGFAETGTIWQYFDDHIVYGVR